MTRLESRYGLLGAGAAALVAFGLYLRTLHPGVGPSLDSIELQIATLVMGIIHPTGSPFYLLLGRLAMVALPGPNPAFRLNLLSAICGALTVGITYLTAHRLTCNHVAAAYAALGLGIAVRFWYQSSVTELYTLNALFVAGTLSLLLAWEETRQPGFYWAATIVYAMSFGNHTSMILLFPAYLYAVFNIDRAMLTRPRNLALTVVIVLLAALQYLYVPLRAGANPPFCNYCPGEDFSLLDYLMGGPFRAQMFAAEDVMPRLAESVQQWTLQVGPWGWALTIIGLWELLRDRSVAAWTLLLTIVAEWAFVVGYAIPDWHDFMTPIYVAAGPLMGYGAWRVWEIVHPGVSVRLVLQYLAALAGTVLVVAALGVSFWTNLPLVDQSEQAGLQDRAYGLLAHAEPGAWLLMPHPQSENFVYSWAVRYVAFAEGRELTVVTPEEVPPPGPPPHYRTWVDVAPSVAGDQILETRPQILLVELWDDRIHQWGMLPYTIGEEDKEAVAGYEVVAWYGPTGIEPLVSPERWEEIAAYVMP